MQRKRRRKVKQVARYPAVLKLLLSLLAMSHSTQVIQKQGTVSDLLGSAGDLAALKHPNAGIALGGMLSLAYEGAAGESSLVEWLEKQFEAGKGLYEAATDPSKSLVGPDVGISVV